MLALSLLDWQCLIMADDHEPAPQTLGMSPPLFQATTQDDESIAQMIALLDIQDAQMIALLDIQDAMPSARPAGLGDRDGRRSTGRPSDRSR
jgi:hypothetical protein